MDDIYKKVEVNGKDYVITKFDARTGIKLARLILSKASGILMSNGESEDELTKMLVSVIGNLSDDDIDSILDKCLKVCSLSLPAGNQPVMDKNGNYGVKELEYDIVSSLKLCIEAIKWGCMGFFGTGLSILGETQE